MGAMRRSPKLSVLRAGGILSLLLLASLKADSIQGKDLAPEGFGGKQPQVAVAPGGKVYVVFGKDKTVYWVQSNDQGVTFSDPQKIVETDDLMLGMRRGPRVAATDDRIVVLLPGKKLMSVFTDDGGKSWSSPVQVNGNSQSAGEGLDSITALSDGSFYAVWLDARTKGAAEIRGARLDKGARVWSTSVKIYDSPDKTVCECCHPSVASDGKGGLVVMWRNWLKGSRDLYFAESTNRGVTFSAAAKLGTGTWPLQACPMDGGDVIAVPGNGVFAVWRRQKGIFLTTPAGPEIKLGNGSQPVLAQVGGSTLAVWQAGDGLVVKGSADQTIPKGAFPSLKASSDGTTGILVWEEKRGDQTVPKFSVVR